MDKKFIFTVIVPLLAPTLGELGLPCFKHWGGGGGGGGRGPPFPTPLYHCPYKAYIKASVPSTTINPLFQRFNYSLVFIFGLENSLRCHCFVLCYNIFTLPLTTKIKCQ